MELNKNKWIRALQIEAEFNRRGEEVTRSKIQDSLQVAQAEAQHIIWALSNKDVIKVNPDVFNADGERVIICADIHIPYQDNLAVQALMEYMLEYRPTTIIIAGDLIDFYQISSFVKNPANKSMSQEVSETKKFLTELRRQHPGCDIIYKEGNHEQRFEKYIFQSASKISDLIDDLIPIKLGLNELNIKYQIDPFAFGKLWILHGHEKPGGAYNPEYICNVIWQYVHDHFAVGHFHRGQEKIFKNIKGDTFSTWALPYMAGKMDYAILNKWNQGFLQVDYSNNGNFRGRLFKILDGNIY